MSFLYDNFISPFAGPVESVNKTYIFLNEDLNISSKDLINATALPFLGSFAVTALGLYLKESCAGFGESVRSGITNGALDQNYKLSLAKMVIWGGLKFATSAANDYLQSIASSNVKTLAFENYHPGKSDSHAVHHMSKVIEHSTHFIFETVTSLYTFCNGANALYALGSGVMAPAVLLGSSLAINWLSDAIVHDKLHETKDHYNSVRDKVQDKINKGLEPDHDLIIALEQADKDTNYWKSIQDNTQYNVYQYFITPLKLALAINASVDDDEKFATLFDALDNLGSLFAHHLEHGDDVADDEVYLDSIKDTLIAPTAQIVEAI